MVKEIEIEGKIYYECGVCSLDYAEREWAEKCDQWCSAHQSCNLEVIGHAVGAMGKIKEEIKE
ncbi:hypothetical protein HZC35_07765 [Candidatus Saganbacteria bacterium]|nr:hypothetical protein [Candidatus Saganbacteria bacterium]